MDDNRVGEDTTSNEIMPFHDAFYFVVVTMSTVGYGDIAPISFKSRLLVACLLMTFMVFVPGQISQISQLMNNNSKAARHWMSARWSGHHILVVCDVDAVDSVEALVKEVSRKLLCAWRKVCGVSKHFLLLHSGISWSHLLRTRSLSLFSFSMMIGALWRH